MAVGLITNTESFMRDGGSIAKRLIANNMNFNCLRTNAVLPKDEWVNLDSRITRIAEERLVVTADLIDMGLTYNVGGIGITRSEWQMESDMTDATVSMEADSQDNRDLVEYQLASVPIPIIHKDFKLGIRQINASQLAGSNIDMTNSDAAARRVAVGMEDLVISGYRNTFGGQPLYGITTHPDRITGTAPGPWTTIDNIYPTVLNMLKAADAAHRYGPFNLYIPSGLGMSILEYYTDGSGQTVANRLEQITPINKISVADRLPANRIVLVQMTTDTIDLAIAQPLMPVEWDQMGGMVTNYKILTAMAPRIKPDANGELGIVDFTIPA